MRMLVLVLLHALLVVHAASISAVKAALLADYGDLSLRPSAATATEGACPPSADRIEVQLHVDRCAQAEY